MTDGQRNRHPPVLSKCSQIRGTQYVENFISLIIGQRIPVIFDILGLNRCKANLSFWNNDKEKFDHNAFD